MEPQLRHKKRLGRTLLNPHEMSLKPRDGHIVLVKRFDSNANAKDIDKATSEDN